MNQIPRHIAVIMDGNGRWSQRKGFSGIDGHRRGADVTKEIIEHAAKRGVSWMTLYAFSSENWKRPIEWVNNLLRFMDEYFRSHIETLIEKGIRVRFIGDLSSFHPRMQTLFQEIVQKTQLGKTITVQVALNYGGRDEIVRACQKLISKVQENSEYPVNIQTFAQCLDTDPAPDPDLLIRTSGEQRISNFLLWQLAYTEFVFMDVQWPDFSPTHFDEAIQIFQGRARRYGA
jgi:undecaprenyl diphosphate synthase